MILILLTSHRTDCFSLCLDCLERSTDLRRFTHIFVIANAPAQEHADIAGAFVKRHANAVLVNAEPRGLKAVMYAQEIILKEHGELVVKLDEDVFVTPGWLDGLLDAYGRNKALGCFLVSALVPNNGVGRVLLGPVLSGIFPEYTASDRLRAGPISQNAAYGIWIWQKFLSGQLSYTRPGVLKKMSPRRIERMLSINCILFDARMTAAILPFNGEMDEHHVNLALERGGQTLFGLVTPYSLAHHYSFGGQQQAIDAHVSLHAIREKLLGPDLRS